MKYWSAWLSWLPLFFPLYLVRLTIAGIPTTLVEILVIITFIISLGVYWKFPDSRSKLLIPKLSWQKQLIWPILLIIIAATGALILTPPQTQGINSLVNSGQIALGIWKGWLISPLLYLASVLMINRDEKWRKQTLISITISGLILALWAILQLATGDFITPDQRASGPFNSANYLSLFLSPILVASCLVAIKKYLEHKVTESYLWIAAWLIMIIALIGSHSYAGLISVAIGLIFGIWYYLELPHRTKRLALLIIGLGFGLIMISQLGNPKLTQLFNYQGNTSSHGRLQIYQVATQMIINKPIFGIGLGQFETQWPLQAPAILNQLPVDWVVLHPHNLYLAFWLNTGIFGFIGLIWLIINVFKRGLNQLTKNQLIRVGLAMFVAILAYGLIDTPFWKNDLALSWWLIIALIV